jgi:hypothetical protein
MLPFKVSAVILCDDIRLEQNNKHILIGVYNGTIVVQDFPAEFPVCWWIQTLTNQTGKFEFDIRLIKDEKDTLLRVQVEFEIHTKGWAAMILPKVQLQLHGPGNLQLQMKTKSESDWITIQESEVRQGDIIGGPPIQRISA